MKTLTFKTIILSDVHLGTYDCKIKEVNHFLRHTRCKRLILNGDIIDGWQLKRSGQWTKEHSRFIRLILKKLEKKDTEIIYLRGNHDDVLTRFLPLRFSNIQILEDYILNTPKGRYLVLHGDVFDAVTMNMVILSHIGDVGYKWLLAFNRFYNKWRAAMGREYYSLSQVVKEKVKSAVSFISKYEEQISSLAEVKGCRGVICGHIHTAADKMIDNVHYLNSGDWVESMTAIVEHFDGTLQIMDYDEFCSHIPRKQRKKKNKDKSGKDDLVLKEVPA